MGLDPAALGAVRTAFLATESERKPVWCPGPCKGKRAPSSRRYNRCVVCRGSGTVAAHLAKLYEAAGEEGIRLYDRVVLVGDVAYDE